MDELYVQKTMNEKIEAWKLIVKERLKCGLTVSEFCERKGFSESVYYTWVARIHKTDPAFDTRGSLISKTVQANSFVEIKANANSWEMNESSTSDQGMAPVQITDRLPAAIVDVCDVKISLYSNATAQFLRDLLKAVRHA